MDYTKVFQELEKLVDYLERHNKNYTKDQYYKILEIQEIVESCISELDDHDDYYED